MAAYELLNQEEEDGLHKSRLLNVEEKPFKRITKRLLANDSFITTPISLPITPPPDAGDPLDESVSAEAQQQKKIEKWRQFKEAVALDFAAFESSIARIQFLLTNNERERQRYAAEKVRIQSTAQDVRDNTVELRVQLEAAQKTLNLRKTYDQLTEKITSNRLLRPREDQRSNLEKLQAEILELEKESKEYAKTWSERREQFGRIVEEGMQLRRLIRDEKEEVERREGMQEGDGEGADEDEASTRGGRASGVNSPRPDSEDPAPSSSASLKLQVEKLQSETTRGASPLRQAISLSETKAENDVDMEDEGEVDELEEGEEEEEDRDERMDTT